MCKRFLVHKPLCVRISARKNCSVQGLLCVTSSVCRNVSVQNASPQPKRKKNETKESKIKCLVSLPFDGNDARRAPQGVILAVLSQFLKASGTNYFLRVIPTKVHFFFDIFPDVLSGIRILSQKCSAILSGILSDISSEILCG